jgi:Flp pilus assembly protein TadD
MVYFQDGKLPQAAQAWDTALVHDPRQAQACHNLGTLAALEERFEDAIRWYERAASLGPRSPDLEDNLAKAREARGALAHLPALERALQASPASPIAWCDLGNGYWYVGRSRPAEQCYRRAIALDPADVRAWGNLGSSLVHEGRVQEAIAVYTQALKVRPDYAEAMVNLAAVYQVLGDSVKATDWAQRASVLKPGDPQAARILKELAANH